MNKDAVQYLEEKHIKALDGVRGLAALLVLTAHILDILFQGTSIFGSTHQVAVLFAYSGMSLFFVLSGVVMEINYGGESNPAGRGGGLVAFMIKRIARLFPLYLVLLVCYNGISALLIKPLVGITYLTLTQSWVNNMQYVFAPAWSISTEFFFYFVFIFINEIRKKQPRSIPTGTNTNFMVILLLGGTFHFLIFRNLDQLAENLSFLKRSSNENLLSYFSYYAPYTRIVEFLIGIVVGRNLIKFPKDLPSKMSISFALAISSVFAVLYVLKTSFGGYILQNFALAPIWAILIWLVATHKQSAKIFESWGLRKTGEISYGIYMLQFMVMTTMVILIPGSDTFSKVSKVFGIIVLTYCLAYGSSVLIEKPARSYLRKLCN